jgi:hypothetical protein
VCRRRRRSSACVAEEEDEGCNVQVGMPKQRPVVMKMTAAAAALRMSQVKIKGEIVSTNLDLACDELYIP